MAYQKLENQFELLSDSALQAWREIPTSVASDCMNRTQAMHAEIKNVQPGMRLCGQARTVTAMVGDGGAVHAALEESKPGDILVVDAGGAANVAVWGGVGTVAALHHGVGGLVIDGAIRDVAEIRAAGFPCFCRAVTPRGPHMQFGGSYGVTTAVGGVPVSQGDLILGDDDGIVVVPLRWAKAVLKLAQDHIEKEKDWIVRIQRGETISEMFHIPLPNRIDLGS